MIQQNPYANAAMAAAGYMLPQAFHNIYPNYAKTSGYMKQDNTTGLTVVTHKRKKKSRFGKRNSFKQKVLRNIPAKHKTTNDNQTFAALTHNTINTCNITAAVTRGTADEQRIGDTMRLLALKLSYSIQSPAATSQSISVRVIVGYSGEEYNLPNTFGSGLGTSELFLPSTGGTWGINGIINPKAFTVLDDRIITINDLIVNNVEIQDQVYTVPCETYFPYQSVGGVFGKNRNLYVVAIGCIVGGVTGTTPAGNLYMCTDLIFKDST